MTNELQEHNLEKSLKVINGEISIYIDDVVVPSVFQEQMVRLKLSFPELDNGWYEILRERVKAKGITNRQLIDAVNDLIDNFQYPKPTIANILNYNKKVAVLNYDDYLKKLNECGKEVNELYGLIDIDGKCFHAKNTDIEKYKLKKWEVKKL